MKNYKKIYIVGACGSGKTTFAKRLSEQLGIPVFALDNIHRHEVTRAIRPDAERNEILNGILKKQSWIIEGAAVHDYTKAIWENCDIAMLCNPSVIMRIYYITKRHISKRIRGEHHSWWINIRVTMRFRKQNFLQYQKFAKQYKKTIVNSAKRSGV